MNEQTIPSLVDEVKYDISVLLPTRGRRESLQRSLMSLATLAENANKIQVLLGFDNDDVETKDWFIDNVASDLNDLGIDIDVLMFEPLGYIRLHDYVSELGRKSKGRWLMFWNDDAVMQTKNWDRYISQETEFSVLRMPTHNEHPYAIFPIVPRDWLILFGYISSHQLSDATISQIGYMLNIVKNIPVSVLHDRADITGNNEDETYANRPMLEGNPNDPRDFTHIQWNQRRWHEADKIAWFLERSGRDMSWWKQVIVKEQDPWEFMLSEQQDPNKQVSKFKHESYEDSE